VGDFPQGPIFSVQAQTKINCRPLQVIAVNLTSSCITMAIEGISILYTQKFLSIR
jgi:hypothetical protein